jgi:hypothetical protein
VTRPKIGTKFFFGPRGPYHVRGIVGDHVVLCAWSPQIESVTWTARPDEPAIAVVTFISPEMDVYGLAAPGGPVDHQ